jgi:hypothetical protein
MRKTTSTRAASERLAQPAGRFADGGRGGEAHDGPHGCGIGRELDDFVRYCGKSGLGASVEFSAESDP